MPIVSTNNERKSEIVDFMSTKENMIFVLKMLHGQGWRLLLQRDNAWIEPRTAVFDTGKTTSTIKYTLDIDGELIPIVVVAIIKPNLIKSDISALIQTLKESVSTYDRIRLADGSCVKAILTNTSNGVYENAWRLNSIYVVQIPTVEERITAFEKSASFVADSLTYKTIR